jgi:hypothetical protein
VADSSVFTDPATGEFGLAVIYDGTGTYEVVKITDIPDGTSLTVTRNIAGTNQAWADNDLVEGLLTKQSVDNFAQRIEGTRICLTSASVDLKTVASDVAIWTNGSELIPTDTRLIPLSSHVLILTSDTVTVDPEITLGSTTAGTDILAATAVTETNQWEVTTLSPTKTAVQALYASVTTGSTATTLTGKIIVEGILVGTA